LTKVKGIEIVDRVELPISEFNGEHVEKVRGHLYTEIYRNKKQTKNLYIKS
jgi:hypothetical protein